MPPDINCLKSSSLWYSLNSVLQVRPLHLAGNCGRLQDVKHRRVTSEPSVTVEVPESADVVIIGKYL
jgi:hypothetical protein